MFRSISQEATEETETVSNTPFPLFPPVQCEFSQPAAVAATGAGNGTAVGTFLA